MYISRIRRLHCPFCKMRLRLKETFGGSDKRVHHAIVVCGCNQYPILNGVLYLSKNKIKKRVVLFLKKEGENLQKKTEIPFFLFRLPLGFEISTFLVSFFSKLNLFKLLSFSFLVRLFSFLRIFNRQWSNYLLNRYKMREFFPSIISFSLVKKNTTILDVGCGAGHLLKILKEKTSADKVVGVDFSIINLYLAKKYFSSDCDYIYTDLNQPLPFQSNSIDYIFLSDTFHYIARQKSLANELERVVSQKGLIILNHLHNKYFEDEFTDPPHHSQTAKKYLSFFSSLNSFLYSEKLSHKGILKYIKQEKMVDYEKKLKTFTLLFSKSKQEKRFEYDIRVNLKTVISKKLL